MYTGIIAALAEVIRCEAGQLHLRLPVPGPLEPGGSFAVNGVCLTAAHVQGQQVRADLSPETLRRTALGSLGPGDRVNLEWPLSAGAPLGGHFVQGHVDTVGQVQAIEPEGAGYRFTFEVDPQWDRYLVEKGSVAVDGISLTAFGVEGGRFSVAVIPHTFRHTNLGRRRVGDPVNVEFDVLGKYAEKLLGARLRA